MFTVEGVVPSVQVNVKGALPVNVKVTFGKGNPAQTLPPPDTTAVGNGRTVTVAEPLPATVQPFTSDKTPVME